MRIVIATGIYPPEVGGPATYSYKLANEFASRGHNVRVVTYVGNQHQSSRNQDMNQSLVDSRQLHLTKISKSWLKPLHYYKFYRAVLRNAEDADLIYCQGPVSEGYPAMLASRKLDIPLVVKVVGDRSWEKARTEGLTDKLLDDFQKQDVYPKVIQKMRDIQKQVCTFADLVITPSEYLKGIVTAWGVEESKIKVIYNAVEIPEKMDIHEARKKLDIPDNKFLITSIGRNVAWKGFRLLEELGQELKKEHPDIHLITLKDVDHEKAIMYLSASDLYVQNTGYEGLPHLLIEAMGLGVPVITTKVGGNPEVVEDGVSGCLVNYNDKQAIKNTILDLYNNPDKRRQFIEQGLSTAQVFSVDKMINQTETTLRNIIIEN